VSTGIGRLQVLAAALLFSTGGAGIKAAAFTGLQVSALRSGIAALVLLMLLRGLSTGRGTRMLVLSPAMVATGIVYAATLTLFVLSTKLTTAANAIFLQSTAPLYLLLLGPLILHERFRARDVAFLLGVAAGLVLCVIGQPEPTTTAPDPVRGNLLAVVCSITWALTLLGLRYIQRDQTQTGAGLSAVTLGNLFASLAAWPFAWPLPAATAAEWATIAYLGVCQIGLAYVFLTAAMRVLPALEVSLLLLIEPVLNPIWTWVIRGERPGDFTIIGGAIIIAATAIKSVFDARVQGSEGNPSPQTQVP
jgi:drug/metabolite transporter, DME family